jgi:hypothetical protein
MLQITVQRVAHLSNLKLRNFRLTKFLKSKQKINGNIF